jgi:diaminohydroxyphosphoribosylaminopyrimidine deaminase / 5-amino-6-(5-phosphoribosylamino)uracil reductase
MGIGQVSPNPLVGAVLVKDGEIIGEGYHQNFGGPHAEIHALQAAGTEADGSTLYVTLEPCSHYGKTPPCCEALVKAGVRTVICSMTDPNPLVSGKGFAFLQAHGVEVHTGLMSEQAYELNEIFIHYMKTCKPFVILKTAMSLDGKIATRTGESQWISSKESRMASHRLRHRVAAIMVGIGTVLKDDPLLTTRIEGMQTKNPIRIVMDSSGRTPLQSKLFNTIDQAPLLIVGTSRINRQRVQEFEQAGAQVIITQTADYPEMIQELLVELGRRGIDSVLIEGGGTLAEAFFRAQAVNKYVAFIAPIIIGGKDALTPVEGFGIENLQSAFKFEHVRTSIIGNDICVEAYSHKAKPMEALCSQD